MSSKQAPARKKAAQALSRPAESAQPDPQNGTESTLEARWRRTAIAAFFRAEARGFAPGRELEDWLEAERELEALERAQANEAAAAAAPEAPTDDEARTTDTKAAPRKRATGKRSKATRGPTMQARNRGDES